jgi:hypothetical protein
VVLTNLSFADHAAKDAQKKDERRLAPHGFGYGKIDIWGEYGSHSNLQLFSNLNFTYHLATPNDHRQIESVWFPKDENTIVFPGVGTLSIDGEKGTSSLKLEKEFLEKYPNEANFIREKDLKSLRYSQITHQATKELSDSKSAEDNGKIRARHLLEDVVTFYRHRLRTQGEEQVYNSLKAAHALPMLEAESLTPKQVREKLETILSHIERNLEKSR